MLTLPVVLLCFNLKFDHKQGIPMSQEAGRLVIADAEAVLAKTCNKTLASLFQRVEKWAEQPHLQRAGYHENLTIAYMKAIRIYRPGQMSFPSVLLCCIRQEWASEARLRRPEEWQEAAVHHQQHLRNRNAALQDHSEAARAFLSEAVCVAARARGIRYTALMEKLGLDPKHPPDYVQDLLCY